MKVPNVKRQLVYVEWEDTYGGQRGWIDREDADAMRPAHTQSVGWVVRQRKRYLTLAPHLGYGNEKHITQMLGVVVIPVSQITRLAKLAEPKA